MLTSDQLDTFRSAGHLTVPDVFTPAEMQAAIADAEAWGAEFIAGLSESERTWYVERTASGEAPLRKLDNPVVHREVFRNLARDRRIVSIVEQLIGRGVQVVFSQIFMKPPEVGGPKPLHQDNFYFGPDETHALLTVWIALDAATVENGCLYYADGSHRGALVEHVAPEGEPFNLQVPAEAAGEIVMTAAPVPQGGLSLHHGHTLHQSSSNRSNRPRRAAAFHYLRNDASLATPALEYEDAWTVRISE